MEKARQVLKSVFGFDDFISIQAQVIGQVMAGRDTLAVMPTGGGKSLCYQVPALLFGGLTVVVSPLISLMNDQIQQLQQNGVAAAMLNSMLTPAEYRDNLALIKNQRAKLLYMAPETLLKQGLLDLLAGMRVDCLAVDEAHCVSEWGHDFRPEYRRLNEVRQRLGNAVCLALTATATSQVRKDIIATLDLVNGAECIAGFDRPNLLLEVAQKENPYRQTLRAIRAQAGQPGIVYCATRRQVDQLCQALISDGIPALPYHAGMPDEQRRENQTRFSRDDAQVMVATVAFGMGIDKSNVRLVIHYDLPKNIESYYQEIGRAGRDGAPAHCLLLFSYGDIRKVKYMIEGMAPGRQRTANLLLTAMLRYVESDICRRKVLLDYFGESYPHAACGMCDNCRSEARPTEDLTVAAQKMLSCIKRTEERFGVEHVIDVLRGSKSAKIMKFGHHHVSTYGIGLEYSKKQWRQLARQLLQKGFMSQDVNHGALRLAPPAWDLFRGQCAFHGIVDTEITDSNATPNPPSDPGESPRSYDSALFDILRNKRKAMADEARVPPFVIFSDKTLMEMAAWYPQTREMFRQIHGIGHAKEEKYGAIFIDIITAYCRGKNIPERRRPANESSNADSTPDRTLSGLKRRYVEVGEAFNNGRDISELMAQYKVKQSTIVNHLYTYLRNGNKLRSDGLLDHVHGDDDAQKKALAAFDTLGCEALSPVYQALDQTIAYEDLHLLRLYHISRADDNRCNP